CAQPSHSASHSSLLSSASGLRQNASSLTFLPGRMDHRRHLQVETTYRNRLEHGRRFGACQAPLWCQVEPHRLDRATETREKARRHPLEVFMLIDEQIHVRDFDA